MQITRASRCGWSRLRVKDAYVFLGLGSELETPCYSERSIQLPLVGGTISGVCKELMPIHLLSDSSIEKQVALLKALYGKHPYKSSFYYYEWSCKKVFYVRNTTKPN